MGFYTEFELLLSLKYDPQHIMSEVKSKVGWTCGLSL